MKTSIKKTGRKPLQILPHTPLNLTVFTVEIRAITALKTTVGYTDYQTTKSDA
jgi:hypothetical protein